ncbi:MAG: hypothetical protein WCL18_02515 [bacterium]
MEKKEWIILINIIITFINFGIQAQGIKRGKYDSSLAAWSIWSTMFICLFIIYWATDGWTIMVWMLLIQTTAHLCMVIITYNYSEKTINKEDKIMIWISLGGFAIWLLPLLVSYIWEPLTGYPWKIHMLIPTLLGILGQIIADAMGAFLYLKILRRAPWRQPLSAWIISMLIYPLAIYGTIISNESWLAYIFIIYAGLMYGGLLILLITIRVKDKATV